MDLIFWGFLFSMFDLQVIFLYALSRLSSSQIRSCSTLVIVAVLVMWAMGWWLLVFESGETLRAISSEFIPICLSVSPLPWFPASWSLRRLSFSPLPSIQPLSLALRPPSPFSLSLHCKISFQHSIARPQSTHIDRHKYLLTAGCVSSPGPNHFFHFSSPPTPHPTAPTVQPVSFWTLL